jgi:hypothetical protein
MTRATMGRGARALAWALALVCAAGCARREGAERYVPAEADARRALETALRAWQDGQAPGKIDTATPPVVVVDSGRRDGQRLGRYDVLGEVAGDGPRCFAVRLLLDDPPEERKARFVVFGISPVWVFRLEDYQKMIRWECDMTTEKGTEEESAAPK